MRESKIEKYLKNEIEKMGGMCLKFTSSINGVPDRIILMPEHKIYFVELKNETGKVRKTQAYIHRRFNKLGFPVYVPSSKKEVDEFIREVVSK
ncbi:VRR-NUC domain-containing protein [Mammaliicoccus sciuri]|uniref:VRR-NUC domain-containing protein n=1 Tax=Mammaliicoccus sciuri TaxID=1296 RepID=UPI0021CEFADB|nr:VRR-NUC domain-containing protein [Mammaliicoccus sciuri]UXV14884.1 VRR-NUC domain-containing protein [Mammaliicoccus sciuri]UXV25926.1 VRR-NUC domain-containing protein [Mammaliicoccus sciuri]